MSAAHTEHETPFDESVFTDAQWESFRQEDLLAGSHVVGLMLGIFSIGVVLYLIVVYTVLPA